MLLVTVLIFYKRFGEKNIFNLNIGNFSQLKKDSGNAINQIQNHNNLVGLSETNDDKFIFTINYYLE